MKGKHLIACVVAVTCVPVAVAVANTAELTYPPGTRLAIGNTVKGANTGLIRFKTAAGAVLWECTTASMTGALVKNNGTEVEANIESVTMTGTAAESKCTSGEVTGNKKVTFGVEQGLPWCLRSTSAMKNDEFQIRGGKCSEASRQISFGLDDALGECKYKRSEAITGTFSTEPSDAVLTVPGPEFVKEAGSIACTTAYRIELSLTLERDEAGTHPTYFTALPELTYPTGTRLATGNKIRAKNVGELKLTPTSGSFSCTTAELTGTLNTNSGNAIEATMEATNLSGTGSLADCTSSSGSFNLTTNVTSGLPWCLRATAGMGADGFQLRGGGCAEGSRAIKFTIDITGTAECTYERTSALSGTFSTEPEDAVFTISGNEFTKMAGPETCPVAPKLDWTFTLERDEEGTKPAYIS